MSNSILREDIIDEAIRMAEEIQSKGTREPSQINTPEKINSLFKLLSKPISQSSVVPYRVNPELEKNPSVDELFFNNMADRGEMTNAPLAIETPEPKKKNKKKRSGRPRKSKSMDILNEAKRKASGEGKGKEGEEDNRELLAFELLRTATDVLLDPDREVEDPISAAMMADAVGGEIAAASGTSAPASALPAALKAAPMAPEDVLLGLTSMANKSASNLASLIAAQTKPPKTEIDTNLKSEKIKTSRAKRLKAAQDALKAFDAETDAQLQDQAIVLAKQEAKQNLIDDDQIPERSRELFRIMKTK